MIPLSVLLVYLIASEKKFIGNLGKQRSETLLLFCCKSEVVKTYRKWHDTIVALLRACTLNLIVGVLVNVSIHLVVVHKLRHTDIAKHILVVGYS